MVGGGRRVCPPGLLALCSTQAQQAVERRRNRHHANVRVGTGGCGRWGSWLSELNHSTDGARRCSPTFWRRNEAPRQLPSTRSCGPTHSGGRPRLPSLRCRSTPSSPTPCGRRLPLSPPTRRPSSSPPRKEANSFPGRPSAWRERSRSRCGSLPGRESPGGSLPPDNRSSSPISPASKWRARPSAEAECVHGPGCRSSPMIES